MKLKVLIRALSFRRLENISDCEIKGICCHSQNIRPGYLFVAIPGATVDGHRFLDQVIAARAAAVIIQKDLALPKHVAKIVVSDSRIALAQAAATFFGHPSKQLKVIGITGTNGKTSVAYLIERILSGAGQAAAVIGTINYRLGSQAYPASHTTPEAERLQAFLQQVVRSKVKYAIMEVSSHALAQHRVEQVNFACAIFTNLTPEHLDYHKNLSDYFSCKASLFERLNADSWAIINIDDPYGRKLVKRSRGRILTFGLDQPAQIWARDLRLGIETSQFKIVTPKGEIEIASPLIGKLNVYNILAAVSYAFAENLDLAQITAGVKSLSAVPGRLERVNSGQNFSLFIDYAHTEDALEKILQTLKSHAQRRILLIFGCGGDRDRAKRPRMGEIATRLCDYTIITSDNPRSEDPQKIVADILRGVDKKRNNYQVVLDRFEAIRQGLGCAREKDVLVIAGKGHECTQILAGRAIPFNDREAAEEVLQCLQSKK